MPPKPDGCAKPSVADGWGGRICYRVTIISSSVGGSVEMATMIVRETLIYLKPFGLSLSKPLYFRGMPFDKLRANGFNLCFLSVKYTNQSRVEASSVASKSVAAP